MKDIRASAALTPAAAVVSALATLVCCLPLGIGAAVCWAPSVDAERAKLPASQPGRNHPVEYRGCAGDRGRAVSAVGSGATGWPSSLIRRRV
jgi:hypothetical protein